MLKQEKGMTMIALVLTIIVLLFLAAITIALAIDEFNKEEASQQLNTVNNENVVENVVNNEVNNDIVDNTIAQ